jgi:hypothetical protein
MFCDYVYHSIIPLIKNFVHLKAVITETYPQIPGNYALGTTVLNETSSYGLLGYHGFTG